MRLNRRNDFMLVSGLVVAGFVAVSDQVVHTLRVLGGVETWQGLQLLPVAALVVTLCSMHLVWKGREARVEAEAAARAARQADERATGLVRLVDFGHALVQSLDTEAIRLVTASHLPRLLPDRGVWVMTRTRGHWESILSIGPVVPARRERSARLALGETGADDGSGPRDECVPMTLRGEAIGVVGVSGEPALSHDQRSVLSAVAALLALSLRNADLSREVLENSVRDAVTGCFTRAHALEVLEVELRRARRTQMPLSILMMDLDNFRAITDRYGQVCGDTVLATVGQRLKMALRGSDVKCRYGGAEFLVILTDTPMGGAMRVSETLRRDVCEHHVPWDGARVAVTASFGVATVQAGEVDPAAALARAEDALYRAKRGDRHPSYEREYIAVPA